MFLIKIITRANNVNVLEKEFEIVVHASTSTVNMPLPLFK